MRKTFIALGIFMIVNAAPIDIPLNLHAPQSIPAYAKWGTLAVKETQSKYPNAKIIDYLHEGRESQGDLTIEKFKLWLKEGDNEFGVFVRIKYMTEKGTLVTIEFQETYR